MAYDFAQSPGQGQAQPFLRLQVFGSGGHRVEVPLASEGERIAHSGVLDVHPGHVLQSKAYTLTLFVPAGASLPISSAVLSVNGEETGFVRAGSICSQLCRGAAIYEGYEMEQRRRESRPFGLICGYARMSLEVFDAAGARLASFVSKDVACQQDDPISMENVEGMIDALTGDPERDEALRWMAGDSPFAHEGSYSLMEGGYSRGSSRSVPTYLAIIEAGLAAIESALPFLRSHAASRVQREEMVVDSRQVRKVGSREMRWLASHPEELRPASSAAGSVAFSGRRFEPARMSSVKAVRSFDVYENRVCLSFLDAVVASLSDFEAKVRRGQGAVNPFRAGGDEAADPSRILVVAIARALYGKQHAHIEKAARLRARAIRLMSIFNQIAPGVSRQSLASIKLMRTKAFKEIRAYSQIYPHVERFCGYGESVPGEDELAIASLRLDRAYETYVLYRLLSWLSSQGFAPAPIEKPIYAARYGYTSPVFADKPHVCNVYHLARGPVRVDLFYEPVIAFGDVVSNGMTLRRMRRGKRDAYTPDFVLVVTRDGSGEATRRSFVLDAKYRRRYNVLHPYDEAEGSEYDRCVNQYLANVVDVEGWRVPDALWLVCGRDDEDPQIMEVDTVPWRSGHEVLLPSGIALLTPDYDVTPLFEDMGLAEQRPPLAEADADPKAPPAEAEDRSLPSDACGPLGPSSPRPRSERFDRLEREGGFSRSDLFSGEGLAGKPAQGPERPLEEGAAEGDAASVVESAPSAVAEAGSSELGGLDDSAAEAAETRPPLEDAPLGDSPPALDGSKPAAAAGKQASPSGPPPAPVAAGKPDRDKPARPVSVGRTKEEGASGRKGMPAAKGKSAAAGLPDELLGMIKRMCEITVEKETLLDADCAQKNLGFQHPLLRRALPSSSREAKLYTREKVDVCDGSYHVYSRWRPDNVQKLRKTLDAAEKSLGARQPEQPAPRSDSGDAARGERGSASQASCVASLIAEILDATPERARESYFDAQRCRQDMGLSKPLLKNRPDRGYLPLPGHEGVFYQQSKLPTYVKALERHRGRVLAQGGSRKA